MLNYFIVVVSEEYRGCGKHTKKLIYVEKMLKVMHCLQNEAAVITAFIKQKKTFV